MFAVLNFYWGEIPHLWTGGFFMSKKNMAVPFNEP